MTVEGEVVEGERPAHASVNLPQRDDPESIGADPPKPPDEKDAPHAYVTRADLRSALQALQVETRGELVGREPRLIPTFVNLVRYFRPWKQDDPLVWASLRAFAWRLFSPGTITFLATGVFGTIVALYTVLLLHKQNQKLEVQNYMMAIEPRLHEAQRIEADLEALRVGLRTTTKLTGAEFRKALNWKTDLESLANRALPYRRLRPIGGNELFQDELLRETEALRADTWRLKLKRLTNWMAPDDLLLEDLPSSPERARLFKILQQGAWERSPGKNISLDALVGEIEGMELRSLVVFESSDLRDSRNHYLDLADHRFGKANMRRSQWVESRLWVDLSGADVSGACFVSVDLHNAIVDDANLAGASFLSSVLPSRPEKANWHRVHVQDSLIDSTGADELRRLDPDRWQITKATAKDFERVTRKFNVEALRTRSREGRRPGDFPHAASEVDWMLVKTQPPASPIYSHCAAVEREHGPHR